MISLKRITKRKDLSDTLLQLYELSFPDAERRRPEQLFYLIENRNRFFFCEICYNHQSAGLFVYWQLDGCYFLEQLAIFPEMRNHSIGSQLLSYLEEYLPAPRLLEVEPEDDGMAGRRIRYYERNGYTIVDKKYVQPAFDPHKQPIPLWIMCNKILPEKELANFIDTIIKDVYQANLYCVDSPR